LVPTRALRTPPAAVPLIFLLVTPVFSFAADIAGDLKVSGVRFTAAKSPAFKTD
jgi:hypothetical protein